MEVVIMTDITVDTTVDIIEGIDMRTRGEQSIILTFPQNDFGVYLHDICDIDLGPAVCILHDF